MPHRDQKYIQKVIEAIEEYQFQEFLSDRELSLKAGLSPTMISKIKSWKTLPKLSTLKKIKILWVNIPTPSKNIANEAKNDNTWTVIDINN